MGRMVDDLETALEDIEEEGDLILKEEFMIIILQGTIYKITPFEKYWTHMFRNNIIIIIIATIKGSAPVLNPLMEYLLIA